MTILIVSFLFFVGGTVFFLYSEDRSMRKEWKKISEQESQIVMCRRQVEAIQTSCNTLLIKNANLKDQVDTFKKELDILHQHFSEVQTAQRTVNLKADMVETRLNSQTKSSFPDQVSFVLIDKRTKTKVESKPTEGGSDVKKEPNQQNQTPRSNSKPSGSRKTGLGRSFASVRKENTKRV